MKSDIGEVRVGEHEQSYFSASCESLGISIGEFLWRHKIASAANSFACSGVKLHLDGVGIAAIIEYAVQPLAFSYRGRLSRSALIDANPRPRAAGASDC